MSSFEDYMKDILSIYRSSYKMWTQDTRSTTTLTSIRYDNKHYLHIGSSKKLTMDEMMLSDVYEKFASEIRLSVSRDEIDGNSDDPVLKQIGELVKKALESGVACDRDAGDKQMEVCNNRIIVASR